MNINTQGYDSNDKKSKPLFIHLLFFSSFYVFSSLLFLEMPSIDNNYHSNKYIDKGLENLAYLSYSYLSWSTTGGIF